MSSRGYGMFVHTSAPVTFDVGAEYDAHNTIYSGDEMLDIFIFLGEPKEILAEYTALTGRSPVPPLWSFGLWMSRITYKSEGGGARRRGEAARSTGSPPTCSTSTPAGSRPTGVATTSSPRRASRIRRR